MSNAVYDVKAGTPIAIGVRTSGSTASGEFDALGCQQVLVTVPRGVPNVKSRQVLRIRHSSATGTDYASATAFTTALIASVAVSASTTALLGPFRIDMSGKGRYLNFLLSNLTQSARTGVLCFGMLNEEVPPASTGFTSLTGTTTAPNNP